MHKIKVYNFDSQEHFYTGWEWVQQVVGLGLPGNSTDIPPPAFAKGQIPVFKEGKWILVEDNFWRPSYQEVTYLSLKNNDSYQPLSLSALMGDFPTYPNLPQVCNTLLVSNLIVQKLRCVQEKYDELVKIHRKARNIFWLNRVPLDGPKDFISKFASKTNRQYKYHFVAEELVAAIRSALDYLVQLTFVLTSYDQYQSSKMVTVDSIGKYLKLKNNGKLGVSVDQIITGDDMEYRTDITNYLRHINDLSNSIKHSMMHAEVYSLHCLEIPTVVSLQAGNNNHKKDIIYHNHIACQLVIGFQDTLLRILANQKRYLTKI